VFKYTDLKQREIDADIFDVYVCEMKKGG